MGKLKEKLLNNLTPEEMDEKETIKKHYILSKIKNYQDAKLKMSESLITGLPLMTDI